MGRLYKGEALEILRQVTGQDFGWGAAGWTKWLDTHPIEDKVWRNAIWESYRGHRLALIHFPYHHAEEIFKPTAIQVQDAIEHIDTGEPPILILRSSFGSLLMSSAPEDRVTVTFSGNRGCLRKSLSARLLDMDIDDPEGLQTYQVGKHETTRRRCETVPRAIAIEVAMHFVEHDRLPKGFHWTEDVASFTG